MAIGTPEAMAIPIDRSKTTKEAKKSDFPVASQRENQDRSIMLRIQVFPLEPAKPFHAFLHGNAYQAGLSNERFWSQIVYGPL